MDKIKIKLLIVDDEKDIRDSLKDILIDEGYEVHLAENALEAKKIKSTYLMDEIESSDDDLEELAGLFN